MHDRARGPVKGVYKELRCASRAVRLDEYRNSVPRSSVLSLTICEGHLRAFSCQRRTEIGSAKFRGQFLLIVCPDCKMVRPLLMHWYMLSYDILFLRKLMQCWSKSFARHLSSLLISLYCFTAQSAAVTPRIAPLWCFEREVHHSLLGKTLLVTHLTAYPGDTQSPSLEIRSRQWHGWSREE